MSRLEKGSLIALATLLTLAPVASAQRGPGFYGPGFYGPGFYGPRFYGPVYGPRYTYGQPAGSVKIVTKAKGNSVYVDGGYAGMTGKLKKFQLRPGNHTIEFRDADARTFYQERIQVLAGKTLEVYPVNSLSQKQG